MSEFRERPHVIVGVLALIVAVTCLLAGGDRALRQAMDPDAVASQRCDEGGGGSAAIDDDCYQRSLDRSPLDAGQPWLAIGLGGGLVVLSCIAVAAGRAAKRPLDEDATDDTPGLA